MSLRWPIVFSLILSLTACGDDSAAFDGGTSDANPGDVGGPETATSGDAGPDAGDDAGPTCAGCLIDGDCHDEGDRNPENGCEVCDPASSTAWSANEGATCDDGLFCTTDDVCTGTTCGGSARDCSDGVACTGDETCDEAAGVCARGTSTCVGSELCDTIADSCVASCTGCAIEGSCYGDGQRNPANPCSVCDAAASQTDWSPNDGASCDDGLFCTTMDVCTDTTCGGGPRACGDGVACNGDETCDEDGDLCAPGTTTCADGEICDLPADSCVSTCSGCRIGGVCYGDGQVDPTNTCNVCNITQSGTTWTDNDGARCDDGLFCTDVDVCGGGVCSGSSRDCGDGVACNGSETCNESSDRCDAGETTCTDGDICNTSMDMCVLSCVGGSTLCGGACTNTQVDPAHCNGCGMACPSGPNSTDYCAAGTCGAVCVDGFADCTAEPICETDVRSDPANCGGCGVVCAAACVDSVCVSTRVFTYTGAPESYVVPRGVTSIQVDALGAAGGCDRGGLGGSASARMAVTPGETLQLNVGGAGECGTAGMIPGGFNGGGDKFTTSGDFWMGGSGGGASDVRRGANALSDRLIVAGGGGGRGYGGQAGDGGGLVGVDGNPTGGGCNATCAGAGGTQVAGGSGGVCLSGCEGMDGTLGLGGTAAGCAASGGGGGGGYYGGGGGAHCSAGGGSSRADFSGAAGSTTTAGVRAGDGQISITF
ncbi:MAG: hypothetical protein ACI9KE_004735 [Polyangiales bacterium]|jgi:hypothetical protein